MLDGASVHQIQLVVGMGVAIMVGAAVLARLIAPSHFAHEESGRGCLGARKTFEKETVHVHHEADALQSVHVRGVHRREVSPFKTWGPARSFPLGLSSIPPYPRL